MNIWWFQKLDGCFFLSNQLIDGKKNIPVSPKTSSGIMYSEEEWARVWKKRPVKYIEDIIHGDVNGMCIYIYI
jgi:hypothetical protein